MKDLKERLAQMKENLSIYASLSPTFYFAWISVPWNSIPKDKDKNKKLRLVDILDIDKKGFKAPKGTFGFVMLYGHLPPYTDRPAIYFDNSQTEEEWPLLNFYAASTMRFFKYGLPPDKSQDTSPSSNNGTATTRPCPNKPEKLTPYYLCKLDMENELLKYHTICQ